MGVCKVLAEGGLSGGFLSPRFILLFLACLFTLLTNNLFIIFSSPATPTVFTAIVILASHLPGLITGVISTWHWGLLTTFLTHPSLLLLPAVSYFTFESNSPKCCWPAKSDPSNDVEIRFSIKSTYLNIFVTLTSYLATIAASDILGVNFLDNLSTTLIDTSMILPGILSTIIFLCISSPPTNCSSCCFSPLEINVYKPASPSKVFVLDNCSKEVEEVDDIGEEQADSTERGEVRLTKFRKIGEE